MDRVNGFPVYVSASLCQPGPEVQVRRHRKSRINRKWRKKYGVRSAPCPGLVYRMMSSVHCCPCGREKLKAGVEAVK